MGCWGRSDRVALRCLLKKHWILFGECSADARLSHVHHFAGSICVCAVRSFVPNLFLFVLIPAVLVLLLGITRCAGARARAIPLQ